MYYCEPCRAELRWPKSMAQSYGTCEICRRTGTCFDMPHTVLPARDPQPATNRDGTLANMSEQETIKFSKREVDDFLNYAPFNYQRQRLGQAFCNHFKLRRSGPVDQELVKKLDPLDGEAARKVILEYTDQA